MQLVFNNTFDEIIDEKIKYYKNIEELPQNIINFIDSITNTRLIYDELNQEYYCGECFEKLENFYCNHCKKIYEYNKNNIEYEYDEETFKQKHSNIIKHIPMVIISLIS